jgi:hypothetical protein
VAAFWPKYISRPAGEIDAYTHVHAAAMVTWCGLLIAQPLLIRAGRSALHRKLGLFSCAAAPGVIVTSILLANFRFRSMDDGTFSREAPSLYLPLSAVLVFAIAYAGGILYRHTPELHASFMICTSLTMVDPIVGRILAFYFPPLPNDLYYQAVTYGSVELIVVCLAIGSGRRARSRWAFLIMLPLFMTTHLLWFTWAQSDGWSPIAAWFRSCALS